MYTLHVGCCWIHFVHRVHTHLYIQTHIINTMEEQRAHYWKSFVANYYVFVTEKPRKKQQLTIIVKIVRWKKSKIAVYSWISCTIVCISVKYIFIQHKQYAHIKKKLFCFFFARWRDYAKGWSTLMKQLHHFLSV